MFRFDRNANSGKQSGGGLICYARMAYDFTLIEESQICTPDIESFWVKLSLKSARPTFINVFYRPPDGLVSNFIDKIVEDMTRHVTNSASDILMMGDANIDTAKYSYHHNTLKLFLSTYNFKQLIDRPTQITDTTCTIIDHFYTNNQDLYSHRATLEPGLSDHCLILACRK